MARKKATKRKVVRKRAAVARDAGPPPPPPPVHEQLKVIFARLRKQHPNLEGIGVGYRRCGDDQTTEPVLTVRLIVEKKPRPGRLPKSLKRFPAYLTLRTLALGHPVRVRVPTDVEGAPQAAQSSGFGVHSLKAAAFVMWHEEGAIKVGVLTAAHALEKVGQRVGIQGNGGNPAGTVRALSAWRENGIDAAIVEIDRADVRLMDAGPMLANPAPSIDDLIGALGDGKDELCCNAKFWGFAEEPGMTAVAYYMKYPMNYPNGKKVILTDVVECVAKEGKFKTGQSGSLWSAQLKGDIDVPLAVQSHMISGGRRGFGCVCVAVETSMRELLGGPETRMLLTVEEIRAAT